MVATVISIIIKILSVILIWYIGAVYGYFVGEKETIKKTIPQIIQIVLAELKKGKKS